MRQPATIPVASAHDLLALHAVRLKGMADDADIAARFDLDSGEVAESLLDFQACGWVSYHDFAGAAGWSLTAAGRTRNQVQLAQELAAADARHVVRGTYAEFIGHNGLLLRAATDWQLRPSAVDPLAANDHSDEAWDAHVLGRLRTLDAALGPIVKALSARLRRFGGYDVRFATAVARAEEGDHTWVTRPRFDSCHTVWMELHEDLVATLGVERGAEPEP
jgi:hypothetical protein